MLPNIVISTVGFCYKIHNAPNINLCYLDGEGVERDGAAAALAVLRVHRQHVGPPRPQPAHVERGVVRVLLEQH